MPYGRLQTDASKNSRLFQLALVLVRFDHVAQPHRKRESRNKRGKRSKSSLKGASRGMYKSMSKKELRKLAKNQAQETTEEEAPLEQRTKLKG